MNSEEVIDVDRTSDGIIVTFGNGHNFLFAADLLYGIHLKNGQVGEPLKKPQP